MNNNKKKTNFQLKIHLEFEMVSSVSSDKHVLSIIKNIDGNGKEILEAMRQNQWRHKSCLKGQARCSTVNSAYCFYRACFIAWGHVAQDYLLWQLQMIPCPLLALGSIAFIYANPYTDTYYSHN